MRRFASAKLVGYAGLGSCAVVAGFALGLPELIALGAPLVLVVIGGTASSASSQVVVTLETSKTRATEGEELAVTVSLRSERGVSQLDLFVPFPQDTMLVEGSNPVSLRLNGGAEKEVHYTLRLTRWGSHALGRTILRQRGPGGFFFYETGTDDHTDVKVYPRPERVRQLIAPRDTQVFSGNRVSKIAGSGVEFADIRPFMPGDQPRRINWRLSARRQQLWVTENHAERNADVVMFLDSFTDVRGDDVSTLDDAVRAISGVAAEYLRYRDRVGLISFGAGLTWLTPSGGLRHAYRVIDAILGTKVEFSAAWKNANVVPRRTLPPKSLILAFSPLVDERPVTALLELRARGFDLAVIELSPAEYVTPGTDESQGIAYRIWRLERELLRDRFVKHGVPVVEWHKEASLDGSLRRAEGFRRRAMRG